MNNDFKKLIETYIEDWTAVSSAQSLEQLQDAYTNSESSKEEILNWIFENVSDEEEQGQYFATFGDTEDFLFQNIGIIPMFDPEFDPDASFEEYEGYYQRYGCMTPEYLVSWDNQNILFDDGEGNIEIVARPDVLMDNAE